jgi:hypothetical protein
MAPVSRNGTWRITHGDDPIRSEQFWGFTIVLGIKNTGKQIGLVGFYSDLLGKRWKLIRKKMGY